MIPNQVCIKRKRTQDPLQALYVDRSVKKSKPATTSGLNYFFKLGGIGSNSPPRQQDVVMAEAVGADEQNQFKLQKQQQQDAAAMRRSSSCSSSGNGVISDSLADMVQSYLNFQSQVDSTSTKRRLSSASEDYVYDLYYREALSSSLPIDTGKSSLPLSTEGSSSSGGYGFLIFNQDDQDGENVSFLIDDEDNNSGAEDEDSNAEEFYGNDYPDEEERGAEDDNDSADSANESSSNDEWYSDYRERQYF